MSILGAIAGIGGSIVDKLFGDKKAEKDAELQREFAQNGVRWKVADATAAGIHPLYALGAQTHSFAPSSVGSTDFATGGQNLGSAIQAMTTPKEKLDGFAKTVQGLTLEKMGLENEVLRSQLRVVNQPARGPGMPGGATLIDGQGNSAPSVNIGGFKFKVGSETAAQDAENEYGEIGGEIAGGSKLFTDVQKQEPIITLPGDLGNSFGKALREIMLEEARKLRSKPMPRTSGRRGY